MHAPSIQPSTHSLPPVLQRILRITLMIGLLASLSLGLNSQVGYDDPFCLTAGAVYAALLLAWHHQRLSDAWTIHGMLLNSCVLATGIALQTGGVNSPILAWIPMLSLPALALLRVRRALIWIGAMQLIQMLLYWAGTQHWVSNQVNQSAEGLLWSWLTQIQVAASMMLAVLLLESLSREFKRYARTRIEELETAQAALLKAQSHRDEFLASVSHELRTPMNAILGLNQMIRQTLIGHPEDIETVMHIHDSTHQLLQAVNDILDYSQLQAKRMSLHAAPTELNRLLQNCLDKVQPAAHLQRVTLEVTTQMAVPTWVLGDRVRLTQIVCNALRHAFAHSAGGRVSLTMRFSRLGWRVDIHDQRTDTRLIQQWLLSHKSSPDARHDLDLTAQDLSLVIALHLIRMHAGHAHVQDGANGGVHFWFELPLRTTSPQDQTTTDPSMASPPPARQLHVLLVDDNATNLLIGTLVLQKCFPDCHVVAVESGTAALQQLRDGAFFDVLLVDLRMPHMDGLALTRRIRELAPLAISQVPIIALTASTDDRERSQCLASGMQDVLHKPIEEAQLLNSVNQALSLPCHKDLSHAC